MKKIVLLLTFLMVMSSASATLIYNEGQWAGCPKAVEGCPGYLGKVTERISDPGPERITGSFKNFEREYGGNCWFKAEGGHVCGEKRHKAFKAKRFRRADVAEEVLLKDVIDEAYDDEDVRAEVDYGPKEIVGNANKRWEWSGIRRRYLKVMK